MQWFAQRRVTYDDGNVFHLRLAQTLVDLADLQHGFWRVLDVATGLGLLHLRLQHEGRWGEVCGIDISEIMLAKVRALKRPKSKAR
jgi:ubiquinone/menaquinone biosynthesis C-methylase UbiE